MSSTVSGQGMNRGMFTQLTYLVLAKYTRKLSLCHLDLLIVPVNFEAFSALTDGHSDFIMTMD